jgi:MoxR-like ATPase
MPHIVCRRSGALSHRRRRDVTIEELRERFAQHGYIVDEDFSTALELMLELQKPLLIEGPAGIGKTESAKTLANVLGTRLIRLQCYEGLDAASALYEWNYAKQLLRIRLTESDGSSMDAREAQIFSEPFLLKRPLLEAITQERAPVLLIDEIDRADEAFEAFLLELLGEFQVTIPEFGTIRALKRPMVILTSNRTRDLSDALRRRCLYQWLDYPDREHETAILRARIPEINERLATQIARFMEFLREQPFQKVPGVAESLDWALALTRLHRDALDERTLELTRSCVLKVQEDWELLRAQRTRYAPLLGDGASVSIPVAPESDYGIGTVQARRG